MSVAFKPQLPFFPHEAFGKPGAAPNWARASKQGVGTARNDSSRVWFTIESGVVTEVYYPTVGTANSKDMKFIITDGKTFFDEEGVDTVSEIEYINDKAPAFRVTNTAKSGAYSLTKKIVTDPSANSLVMNVRFKALRGSPLYYRLYMLFAPHIKNRGYDNSGRCAEYLGRGYLMAWREDITAVLSSDAPFLKMSAGFSGSSDGWQDLHSDLVQDWFFERAEEGSIALTAEVGHNGGEFNIVLSFGRDEIEAVLESAKTLGRGYREIEREYIRGWKRYINSLERLGNWSLDGRRRYWASAMVLKTHEDKTHKGGLIASLSVPWGEAKGDRDAGGYHLVWPRDLCKGAFAFMSMGDGETALNTLKYLQNTQSADGSWPQNMWISGEPYWNSVQLDEVALPVILAWRLKGMGMAGPEFYPMVKKAASYIVINGPVTDQERWEENMGFSPATLAAEITALVSAAHWALEMGEHSDSEYLFTVADYWQTRLEQWTFSQCDCMGADVPGHYMHIVQSAPESLTSDEQLCHAIVFNRNRPMDVPHHQGELVDAGFLDLVSFGVRHPKDEHIVSSLEVVDRMLRFETDGRTAFYRFNGDGYGEKEDGSPFDGSGKGRPWPLITGERALYEILADGDPGPYMKSLEGFANEGLMFPEQVWDGDDIPDKRLQRGRGTGAATPLMWAHSEYIKILRTLKDWAGCDTVSEVKKRYVDKGVQLRMSAWKKNRPIHVASTKDIIRIIAFRKASLHWTQDNWNTESEDPMTETTLGVWYMDFKPETFESGSKLDFTFHYTETDEWEGRDYELRVY